MLRVLKKCVTDIVFNLECIHFSLGIFTILTTLKVYIFIRGINQRKKNLGKLTSMYCSSVAVLKI